MSTSLSLTGMHRAVSLPSDADVVVRAHGVNYAYGVGETRTQVLFDNDLEISRGEVVIMTGPSGSGKSTLLTLIGALRKMQQGALDVLGHELSRRRRRSGRAAQAHRLHLPATQSVQLALRDRERPHGHGAQVGNGQGYERSIDRDTHEAGTEGSDQSSSGRAFRRPEAACGDRPGTRQRAVHGAGRRAHGLARRGIKPDRPRPPARPGRRPDEDDSAPCDPRSAGDRQGRSDRQHDRRPDRHQLAHESRRANLPGARGDRIARAVSASRPCRGSPIT